MEITWQIKATNEKFGVVDQIKLERKCVDDNGDTFTNQSLTSFASHAQKPSSYWTQEKLDEYAETKRVQMNLDEFPDAFREDE